MTTPKTEPWALLREARESVERDVDYTEIPDQVSREHTRLTKLLKRIDVALAEVNPCRLIDVGDGGISRERAEADAFRRGVKAMREAAAQIADAHCVPGTSKQIRALPDPEDK